MRILGTSGEAVTPQQAGVSAEAVAKLVAEWRDRADLADGNARNAVSEVDRMSWVHVKHDYNRCIDELESALATAPPEQAAPKDLGSALRIDNLSRTSSPVVREETAPQAMLKAERAEAVGGMLEAYENARAITVQPDQPLPGALDDLISRCDELRLNRRRYGNLKWEAETGHLLARCAEAMRALAAHDQKVQAALRNLLDACLAADANEELSEFVDGSLLDAARAALASGAEEKK